MKDPSGSMEPSRQLQPRNEVLERGADTKKDLQGSYRNRLGHIRQPADKSSDLTTAHLLYTTRKTCYLMQTMEKTIPQTLQRREIECAVAPTLASLQLMYVNTYTYADTPT